MADVYNDTVVINEFDTSEFVYNKISGLWVKYPNGYLTIATNDHLGVVKGTQPPADPTDESKDIYVQVLPDGSMRLVGDRLGKINTVNGISPDTNKNVQTDYIYETEADFEADKNNIPVGATVIKLYEYPDNHPYDLNRPDLWPLNTEIDFGGGLFGQHKAGTFTDTAERAVNRVVMLTLTGAQVAPESTFRLVDFGGNWQPNASMAMAEPVRGTNTYPESSIAQWSNFWVDMDNKWVAFRSWTLSARTGCTYDVWFTYKK
jgi:hypothetical protein